MIEILYQDDNYVFVNKPSGLLVHRTVESQDCEFLLQKIRNQIGRRVYPVHRLDRGVSGVVGFGLTPDSAKRLQAVITGTAEKYYVALVRGRAPSAGEISLALHDDNEVLRECRTEFKTIASNQYCSLLEIRPHTGRRHQIRRHLSSLAHHILGDVQYGKGRLNKFYRELYGLNRIFLHAWRLNLTFPDGRVLSVVAPMPEELLNPLDKLCTEGLFDADVMKVLDGQRKS